MRLKGNSFLGGLQFWKSCYSAIRSLFYATVVLLVVWLLFFVVWCRVSVLAPPGLPLLLFLFCVLFFFCFLFDLLFVVLWCCCDLFLLTFFFLDSCHVFSGLFLFVPFFLHLVSFSLRFLLQFL